MLFKRFSTLVFIGVISFFISMAVCFLPVGAQAAVLDEIHLSWQNDPATTMTIMWRTDFNQVAPRVQYGTTTNYGQEAVGTTQNAVLDGYFYHTVELVGLLPNTVYHYRVSGQNTFSNDYTFSTAPNGSADFSFTAFADNGTGPGTSREAYVIKEKIATENSAFYLVPGDLSYADGDYCSGKPCFKEHWELWFQELELFSHFSPIMTTFGNHENKTDVKFSNGETFYTRSLALPQASGSELYYSFDYGDVHFIALDSENYRSLEAGQNQYEWLLRDLQNKNKKFTIVYFHHTTFSSGKYDPIRAIQRYVVPLFDQYNVDLVVSGHDHHYERTLPLVGNASDYETPVAVSTETTNYTNVDGTVYVITGGAGGSLYDFKDPKPSWSQVRYKGFEYIKVDVDDAGSLIVTAKDLNGGVVDRFTISKTASVISGSSASVAMEAELPITNTQSIRAFNFAVWWHDTLSQSSTQESIRQMKSAGANYFGLAPFWYQDNKNSTIIYRHSEKSATDESIRSAIRYAKSQGLKVILKPMVDSRDGTWRGQLNPTSADDWFRSYKDFILNFARLSEAEGVEWLVIGTEFDSLTTLGYSNQWREIISAACGVYHGKITYAANWGKRSDGEYYQVDWWDALDAIGIDAYFPLSVTDSPSVAEVTSAWTSINNGGNQNWFNDIKSLHEQYNKPVIFTEIGFLSCNESGIKPWSYPCSKGVDLQEQANLYQGTLDFWKDKDWMLGYLFWRWDADPNKGGTSDGDYLVQNKQPALDVLKQYWTEPSLQSLPSSQPPATISQPPVVVSPSVPTIHGGGNSATIGATAPSSSATTPQSTTPNNLITQHPNNSIFAYGKPRLRSLNAERAKAWELSLALRPYFKGAVSLNKKFWPVYINAYIYGDYPVTAIARAIKLGGKTVHTTIPWTAWSRSAEYQKYIGQ